MINLQQEILTLQKLIIKACQIETKTELGPTPRSEVCKKTNIL
jgi:hypothetical protein